LPHLHIEQFQTATLPHKVDNIVLKRIAINVEHCDERLVEVEIGTDHFFLLSKQSGSKNLLKSDKTSRPSTTAHIKQALNAYADIADLKVIDSNTTTTTVQTPKRESHLKFADEFEDIFKESSKTVIEVGFGSGRHLLYQALNNPDVTHVGIEIHRPSLQQVSKQITIQGLDNLYLLDYDARLFFESIPSNSIDTIFVHFPVPWDKKPHRRVISRVFVDESLRILKLNGSLELRTDSPTYFEYSLQTLLGYDKLDLHICKNRTIDISSKYEDRWVRQERDIYDLTVVSHEESKSLQREYDFSFQSGVLDRDIINNLNATTIKNSNSFVHFERLFEFEEDKQMMFRLSLGAFERPEHLYLILASTPYYFPSDPAPSQSAYQAHQSIKEVLYG